MAGQSASSLLEVEVEQVKLQAAFHKYAEATGKKLGAVVKQNARLIAWNLAHNTQPYGMDVAAKKLGEAATLRDVGKVFIPAKKVYEVLKHEAGSKVARKFNKAIKAASSSDTFAKAFWKLLKGGKYGDVQRILKDTGLQYLDIPIGQPNSKVHSSKRNRHGRVTGEEPSMIVPNAKDLREYGKAKKAMVGFGKAGWITAASSLGSIARVPAWITRHKGKAPGHADDHTDRRTDPYVVLYNDVRYASQIIPDSEVAAALKIQTEKMLAHIEHVLVNAAKESGMDVQPTAPSSPPENS